MTFPFDDESIYRLFAAVSACLSGAVVVTGLKFSEFLLNRKNVFSQLVFWISLCDVITCASYIIGFPSNNTYLCSIQAFLLLFSCPAAWIWTCLLVFQLRCLTIYRKLWLKWYHMHTICWSISLLCALLPLSTNDYGVDDVSSGESSCSIGGNAISGSIWFLSTFIGVFFCSTIILTYWTIEVFLYLRLNYAEMVDSPKYVKVLGILQTCRWYPIAMAVAFVPLSVANYYIMLFNGQLSSSAVLVVLVLSTQYGSFAGILFFTHSGNARQHWHDFFAVMRERCHSSLQSLHINNNNNYNSNPNNHDASRSCRGQVYEVEDEDYCDDESSADSEYRLDENDNHNNNNCSDGGALRLSQAVAMRRVRSPAHRGSMVA